MHCLKQYGVKKVLREIKWTTIKNLKSRYSFKDVVIYLVWLEGHSVLWALYTKGSNWWKESGIGQSEACLPLRQCQTSCFFTDPAVIGTDWLGCPTTVTLVNGKKGLIYRTIERKRAIWSTPDFEQSRDRKFCVRKSWFDNSF